MNAIVEFFASIGLPLQYYPPVFIESPEDAKYEMWQHDAYPEDDSHDGIIVTFERSINSKGEKCISGSVDTICGSMDISGPVKGWVLDFGGWVISGLPK